MDLRWTIGMDPAQAESFRRLLGNSSTVLGRLREILLRDEEQLLRQELSLTDYDTPNWDVKQAHRNGDRARLRKVIDLITLGGKE